MSELLPCPFCAGKAKAKRVGSAFTIYCENLHRFNSFESKEEAVRQWNARPAPVATNTRLETIGYAQRGAIGLLMEGAVDAAVIVPKPGGEFETPVVMREKADELLAEKDVIIRSHLATIASFETKLAASEEARAALSDEIEQGN